MAKKMKADLNTKFGDYGVMFESCTVQKVHVPPDITKSLEDKSAIKYQLQNHVKSIENKKLTLENAEN